MSFMAESVYHFRESGGWLVKGEHTKEEAVAVVNSFFEPDEHGGLDVIADIGIYPDETPDRPYESDDFRSFLAGWYRWVPGQPGDDCGCYLHYAKPHTRGAFQAVQLDY